MLRGYDVADPHAAHAVMTDGTVTFDQPVLAGRYRYAELLPSVGDYGRYIDSALVA
ncbi:hypothetical protein ACFQZ4_49530 [Catellatospora coxensis]